MFVGFTTLIIGKYLKLDFASILIFSAFLSLSDYLRTYVLTGFPWNLWAYSTTSVNEILQIVNQIGIHSYNLLTITVFTLPIIILFQINNVKKFFIILFVSSFILGLYIYGNYEINKNKKFLENNDEKIYVKIISPNFDLQYGLTTNEIEERFKKLVRYSDPEK